MGYRLMTDGDGEVVVLEPGEHFYLACCDCNLVHKFTAKVDRRLKDLYIVLDIDRAPRRTAALRRKNPSRKSRSRKSK